MKNKKKIIIVVAVISIILIGIIAGVCISNNTQKNNNIFSKNTSRGDIGKNKDSDKLTEIEKEIAGITEKVAEDIEENEKTYSEAYKEYLKLSEEEQENSEVIPRKQEVPIEKLDEIKEILNEEDRQKETVEIPERFNLAEKIDIKVENQGSYGLCWDFASLKSLETYLALNDFGDYDLSEMHVNYIESNLMYGSREVHTGGNFNIFKKYISESGVVTESEVPYRVYDENEYSKFADIEKVTEVTETVDFPSIYKGQYAPEYSDEQLDEFRETVKKHIMKNGGLYAEIVATSEKNHYSDINCQDFINHAITIVGWDDNYSKENFLSSNGNKPSKDGAYIALNSWGTFYNDGGYYYISYEDKYVESGMSGIISTSIDNAYKVNSIKNNAIKEYLKNNYEHQFIKYQGEDYITKNTLSNIYSLDLSNSNISSIEGLEIFNNLSYIDLSNNNITDITALSKLTSLNSINLSNNNIKDVTPLSNIIKNIYNLDLSNNKIKDVSDLSNTGSKNLIDLNLSNNVGIVGYEKIANVYYLNLSGCNIKNISNLEDMPELSALIISDTPNLDGIENLPESIEQLDVSNCKISNLDILKNKNNITSLNISNNEITSLEGLENFKYLYSLDVSGNPITNWDAIKEIDNIEDENEENDEEYYGESSFIANNCNIDDITIFNDIKINMLSLKGNNIKDVSGFNNQNVYYIDLSNNANLEGLEGLSNLYAVFLNNCELNDINEIKKLENVISLSIEDNNFKDITEISKLKNISDLSLAGNTGITGTVSSDTLAVLNLSNCNLDDNFDFSHIPNLSTINISNNAGIREISKIIKNSQSTYISIIADEIEASELEKIVEINTNRYWYIQNAIIKVNYDLDDNENQIDLRDNKVIKRLIMQSMGNNAINTNNGHLNKNGYLIDIEDLNKDSVEVKVNGFSSNLFMTTIKIIYRTNENKETTGNLEKNTNDIKNGDINDEINNSDGANVNENLNSHNSDFGNNLNKNSLNMNNTSNENVLVENINNNLEEKIVSR